MSRSYYMVGDFYSTYTHTLSLLSLLYQSIHDDYSRVVVVVVVVVVV